MRPAVLLPFSLLSCLLMAACAGGKPDLSPQPSRGATLAAQKCSGCHALGPVGESPRSGAPPFRDLRVRFNELSLEHQLGEMNGQSHFEMPRVMLQPGEVSDLAAYIASGR
jgi:cytochrome c